MLVRVALGLVAHILGVSHSDLPERDVLSNLPGPSSGKSDAQASLLRLKPVKEHRSTFHIRNHSTAISDRVSRCRAVHGGLRGGAESEEGRSERPRGTRPPACARDGSARDGLARRNEAVHGSGGRQRQAWMG